MCTYVVADKLIILWEEFLIISEEWTNTSILEDSNLIWILTSSNQGIQEINIKKWKIKSPKILLKQTSSRILENLTLKEKEKTRFNVEPNRSQQLLFNFPASNLNVK